MRRVAFYIDGFNVYHALQENPEYWKYKWLSYAKLAQCYVTAADRVVKICYFTAYVTWDRGKETRHRNYTAALRTTDVDIVHGAFRRRERRCRLCGGTYRTFEEKQTDVNIAINLFEGAVKDIYDAAIIVSADSDLAPAIEAVKSAFPHKEIGVVLPIGRPAEYLKKISDFHVKMKRKHLQTSQFEDIVELGDGRKAVRPPSWR